MTEPMDNIPSEADHYIKESIEETLGLPVSIETIYLKFAASEYLRCRLEDQVSVLQEKVNEVECHLKASKVEAIVYNKAVKKCISEKKDVLSKLEALWKLCFKLKVICAAHEGKVDWIMQRVWPVMNQQGKSDEETDRRILELFDAIEVLHDCKEELTMKLDEASEQEDTLFQSCESLILKARGQQSSSSSAGSSIHSSADNTPFQSSEALILQARGQQVCSSNTGSNSDYSTDNTPFQSSEALILQARGQQVSSSNAGSSSDSSADNTLFQSSEALVLQERGPQVGSSNAESSSDSSAYNTLSQSSEALILQAKGQQLSTSNAGSSSDSSADNTLIQRSEAWILQAKGQQVSSSNP